jgi:hypothetical protein
VGTDWAQGRKKSAARNHQWEVIRLRARGERLGIVAAADETAALKAAVKAFEITDAEQKRPPGAQA